MRTAIEVLTAFVGLPEVEQRKVRAALRPPRQGNGRQVRSDRATRRALAVHDLITTKQLPTRGEEAWLVILQKLMNAQPHLTLTRELPPGATLDTVAPHWVHKRTISPRGLRLCYFAWLRRQKKSTTGSRAC
jgi:hypothetical protein